MCFGGSGVYTSRQWWQYQRSRSCDKTMIKRDVAALSGLVGCARR
jgi:hypothetical protein